MSKTVCLILVQLFSTGCIVIPVGELLKGPALQEQTLVEGGGIFSQEKIAIIDVSGVLRGDDSDSIFVPHENSAAEIKAKLDRAAADDEVRAVVLRISSPGGEVTASDVMHREILQFREKTKKPVVACIVATGASGAYYVANAADWIVAHPTAIVGSVGVILQNFDLSGLLDKIGVKVAPVKSSEQKDIGSIFRPLSPDERQVLQKLVDDSYQRFIDIVAKGRSGLTREQVTELADGRVVSGTEALRLKMVDAEGYLSDAIAEAQKRAQIEDPTIVRYTRTAQSGANLYTQLGGSQPTPELQLSVRSDGSPGVKLMYLWQPGS